MESVSANNELTKEAVSDIFEACDDPFLNLHRTNFQASFIKNNMDYAEPVQYILGTNIVFL